MCYAIQLLNPIYISFASLYICATYVQNMLHSPSFLCKIFHLIISRISPKIIGPFIIFARSYMYKLFTSFYLLIELFGL